MRRGMSALYDDKSVIQYRSKGPTALKQAGNSRKSALEAGKTVQYDGLRSRSGEARRQQGRDPCGTCSRGPAVATVLPRRGGEDSWTSHRRRTYGAVTSLYVSVFASYSLSVACDRTTSCRHTQA